jgi:phosphoribosylanthranilate isomerase
LLDSKGGGTGKSFDWKLLDGVTFTKPWMLAGGLKAGIVGGAIKRMKPDAVDVSSGVESERGVKDPDKIRAFIKAVKAAV